MSSRPSGSDVESWPMGARANLAKKGFFAVIVPPLRFPDTFAWGAT